MSIRTIEIEGLSLLMTPEDAIAVCRARDWEQTFKPADGRYTIAPGPPVLVLEAVVEAGRIVSLEATYDPADAARAASPLAQLPVARQGALLGKTWRAAWASDRTIAIVADGDGNKVIGVHLGVLASARDVRAYVETYGGGLAPPERA
jgi:hypothetical protein